MLTYERAHELFTYEPDTGNLIRNTACGGRPKGGIAGCKKYRLQDNQPQLVQIGCDMCLYSAHRVIILMQTGKWPTEHVDHIDLNPFNNKWSNLRQATRLENLRNKRRYRSNTSGYKGASYDKGMKKWRALITASGKSYRLGWFGSAKEAHEAYCAAADRLHGDFKNYGKGKV